jgi:hypothetical protein
MPLPPGSFQRTSGYGPRTLGGQTRMHHGIDWAAPEGTPIYAAADGTVLAAHCTSPRCDIPGHLGMPGSGLAVIIDHGAGVATLYAHASALAVTEGQPVTAGQVIARVGSTGNSTGNHLHFQLHLGHPPINDETAIDPDAFLLRPQVVASSLMATVAAPIGSARLRGVVPCPWWRDDQAQGLVVAHRAAERVRRPLPGCSLDSAGQAQADSVVEWSTSQRARGSGCVCVQR